MRIHELMDKKEELLTGDEKVEKETLVKAFVDAFNALASEHGMTFAPMLRATPAGIIPIIDTVKFVAPKVSEDAPAAEEV